MITLFLITAVVAAAGAAVGVFSPEAWLVAGGAAVAALGWIGVARLAALSELEEDDAT